MRRIGAVDTVQTRLGLAIIGFELIVLAWSAALWRTTEAMVAGVVGSVAYNVTMTLGAGALTHPLSIAQARLLDLPLLMVQGALARVAFMAARCSMLGRLEPVVPLLDYPLFIALCFAR